MRVQEKLYTTCAKMTEERGLNGSPEVVSSGSKRSLGPREIDETQSPGLTPSDIDRSTVTGGRLKFFKDGKFILELSHRKEGDRTSWVPVPKKTYWPFSAAGAGTAGTPRQESSTSLSVSDDNSSIQSSPWQRDHCWKQSNPQRGISKEMTFFMQPLHHMKKFRNLYFYSYNIRRKRRCPYEPIDIPILSSNDKDITKLSGVKRKGHSRAKLTVIVQTLFDRVLGPSSSESVAGSSSGAIQNQVRTVNIASVRMDPSIISPRKRILREMERVSLDDLSSSKRRARTTSALPLNNNGSNSNYTVTCQTLQLSSVPPLSSQASNKGTISSYSITSLLSSNQQNVLTSGADNEPSFLRSLLKSSSQQISSPEISPRPRPNLSKGRTDSGRKTSPSQSQQIPTSSPTLSPSPDSHNCGLRTSVIPSIGSSSHQPINPFLGAPLLYPALTTPYLPHHPATPGLSHHPYYSGLNPVSPYRGSPSTVSSLWVNYPLSSLPRGTSYPGLIAPCHAPPLSPWSPLSRQPLDNLKHDDGASDVPLNLSKHAG